MSPKFYFWLTNTFVSIATVITVLFATGRSHKSTYAALLQLGTSAYTQLCQITLPDGGTVPIPGPGESDGSGNPGGSDTGPLTPETPVTVPEPSGIGGLVILAGLWTGVALVHRWGQRQSQSVLSNKE